MQIVRLSHDGAPKYAVVEESRYMFFADDPMFGSLELNGQFAQAGDARLLAPMIPRSQAVGFSGVFDVASPRDLGVFLKPNTAVAGPDSPIVPPGGASEVNLVPQLAAVVSKACKDVSPKVAKQMVWGYTLALSASVDAAGAVRADAFDGSLVLGPVLDTELDPGSVEIAMKVAGEERAAFSMAEARVTPAETIAEASRLFTLLPGDIVLLGAPDLRVGVETQKIVQVVESRLGELVAPVLAG